MSIDNEISVSEQSRSNVKNHGNMIDLCLSDGLWRSFHLPWLALVAHYEIDFPVNDLLKVNFVDCPSRLLNIHCGKLMIFSKPIYYRPGLRIVPGLTRYAVDRTGNVYSIFSGKQISSRSLGPYGYPMTSCYDPDKNRYRQICTHILVARAWCRNKDPAVNIVVNHKDGVKTNIDESNLEWTTQGGNASHARESGLHTDSTQCILVDIEDGSTKEFDSISAVSKYLGFKRPHISFKRRVGNKEIPKIYRERYVIATLLEDIEELCREAIATKDLVRTGPYQSRDIVNGVVFEGRTMKELAIACGLTKDAVEQGFKVSPNKPFRGFLFREKCSDPWPEPLIKKDTTKSKGVICKRLVDGLEKEFVSLAKTCVFLGCDKTTVKRRISTGSPINGYVLREL